MKGIFFVSLSKNKHQYFRSSLAGERALSKPTRRLKPWGDFFRQALTAPPPVRLRVPTPPHGGSDEKLNAVRRVTNAL